ncbi:MAG: phosphatidylserine decarboxylase [bacterium]|jgi:phosphatidylserine decarboxylase
MKYLFLKLLPKNLVSRLAGKLADAKLPAPLLQNFIRAYRSVYNIDLDDVVQPVGEMKTFNEFFTRQLKESARPVDQTENGVVSPVDGRVSEFGQIQDGLLIQTKGILYSLTDLVGKKYAETFKDGYFATIYLSPADYHRIHTPVSGTVKNFSYFSGSLWPVNDFAVKNVTGLFCLNERILTPIESEKGTVGVMKVGATVVGKIKLNYSKLESNSKRKGQLHLPVAPRKNFNKGDELGLFQLGSTVILLFEKGKFEPHQLSTDKIVKMGELIGFEKTP